MEADKSVLLANLALLHTTPLGLERIRRNASPDGPDAVAWCRRLIEAPGADISRAGKNWYIYSGGRVITVNARSYTIITAHKSDG